MVFQLEICAFNLLSCITAEQSGAHRIELCDNPSDGGTTPSYGLIRAAREKLILDIYPIIRPHGGDFLYSSDDYDIMEKDVRLCKELGCNGVVIGLLNKDGTVDKKRTSKLVALAYPMGVTFHRAFDRVVDPFRALEDIIELGCERILTSGQKPLVMDGTTLLKELVEKAADRIIIMPGSGVRANNVKVIASSTGAVEFHTTARTFMETAMDFVNKNMNESLNQVVCDGDEVKQIVEALKSIY